MITEVVWTYFSLERYGISLIVLFICLVYFAIKLSEVFTLVCEVGWHHGSLSVVNMPEEGNFIKKI